VLVRVAAHRSTLDRDLIDHNEITPAVWSWIRRLRRTFDCRNALQWTCAGSARASFATEGPFLRFGPRSARQGRRARRAGRARVQELVRGDDPADAYYFAVMNDPEGNEFCVA